MTNEDLKQLAGYKNGEPMLAWQASEIVRPIRESKLKKLIDEAKNEICRDINDSIRDGAYYCTVEYRVFRNSGNDFYEVIKAYFEEFGYTVTQASGSNYVRFSWEKATKPEETVKETITVTSGDQTEISQPPPKKRIWNPFSKSEQVV